jgi:hypothetical protein
LVRGGLALVRGGLASIRGGLASVRGGLAVVRGGLASVRGGLASVRGGLASVRGGLVSVRGGPASVRGGLALVRVIHLLICLHPSDHHLGHKHTASGTLRVKPTLKTHDRKHKDVSVAPCGCWCPLLPHLCQAFFLLRRGGDLMGRGGVRRGGGGVRIGGGLFLLSEEILTLMFPRPSLLHSSLALC